MGIEYAPKFVIGKEFEDLNELDAFLIEHKKTLLTEADLVTIESYYETDDLELVGDLVIDNINAYTGYGYTLGFEPNVRDIDNFADNVNTAINRWFELTGWMPEIIHTVKVY